MKLSVAYTFAPDLLGRLAAFPEVEEVYGKLRADPIGGGRSSYTLRPASSGTLRDTVDEAHRHGIRFNYLVNGATLQELDQTRRGQKKIRRLLDRLVETGVDCVTMASPYLLRVVKECYPTLGTRVSAFAVVDSPVKARLWEDMGADTICVSAIACNRDFERLAAMRRAVSCDLQLIVNASCMLGCAHELTHMNMLTASSSSASKTGGLCLDYCFLNCSSAKLADPVHFLKATWIRPEDLHLYESIGYHSFKIVERSCPTDLLARRVAAYVNRSFDGNLLEIAGPVAQVSRAQGASLRQRLAMVGLMAQPHKVRIGKLLDMKRYAEQVIPTEYERGRAPVYIDNKSLDGFLDGIRRRDCARTDCATCGYCAEWAREHVEIDSAYRRQALAQAQQLDRDVVRGTAWL
ncbi:MAG: peptidase U32 [Chitinivibrionales bacterium]|nr:peptidase U32 [Chitinivibrionales bacterium]